MVSRQSSWSFGESSPRSVVTCPETFIDISNDYQPDVDRLLEPRQRQQGTLRCRVLRTKAQLSMFVEEGNVFVLSARKSGKDWLISDVQDGGKSHVARLLANADGSYTCTHDDNSESLYVTHASELLQGDDSLPAVNTMRVAHTCGARTRCSKGELACALSSGGGGAAGGSSSTAVLASKKPKWNSRLQTFELGFNGRAKLASARNFQLVSTEATRHGERTATAPVLLYGKLDADEFALDFAHPLSMLQALAIVLTSTTW